MGGERFDTPQPESYLFGENSDLNFLGSRPAPVSAFNEPSFCTMIFFCFSFPTLHHSLMNQQEP